MADSDNKILGTGEAMDDYNFAKYLSGGNGYDTSNFAPTALSASNIEHLLANPDAQVAYGSLNFKPLAYGSLGTDKTWTEKFIDLIPSRKQLIDSLPSMETMKTVGSGLSSLADIGIGAVNSYAKYKTYKIGEKVAKNNMRIQNEKWNMAKDDRTRFFKERQAFSDRFRGKGLLGDSKPKGLAAQKI